MPKTISKKIKPSGRKRKAGWKGYQNSRKINRQVSLGLAVLTFLVLLIIIGKLLGWIGGLGQAYSPDSPVQSQKLHQWAGNRTLNLVVKSDHLYVLSLNPQDKSASVLEVPDETIFNTPFGFGNWPSRSVYGLGQVEKPPLGALLIKETVASGFGIPIDGYVILQDTKVGEKENIFDRLRGGFLGLGNLRASKTDLTLLEMVKLWWEMKGIRADKIKTLDLANSQITNWILLADGSRGLTLDQLQLDRYIQGQFEDNTIREEGLSVGIFNATEHPGLAEKAARTINNMGGRVIFTTNFQNSLQKSLVLGKSSYTSKRLSEIFGPICSTESAKDKCDPALQDSNFSRSEVTVVLGEDYYQKYSQRPTH